MSHYPILSDLLIEQGEQLGPHGADAFLVDHERPETAAAPTAGAVDASSFPAVLRLATLDGSDGVRLDGLYYTDRTGAAVAGAGDLNGDGFADMVIGSYRANAADFYGSGAAYVIFGTAAGFDPTMSLGDLDGHNGFELHGHQGNLMAGAAVNSAGDVNGDGFDDLIVSATRASPHGKYSGSTYVLFGHDGGFDASIDLSTLHGASGFRIDGSKIYSYTGGTVSSAGDVNGDGFDDLTIGAGGWPGGDKAAGYVVYGHAGAFKAAIQTDDLDGKNGFAFDGAMFNSSASARVAGAGDINGDGLGDIIIGVGASGPAGQAYVLFGHDGGFAADVDLDALDGSDGFAIRNADSASYGGTSAVSSAGDINGDGFADLIIGAGPAAWVVFGKDSGFHADMDLSNLRGGNGFRIDRSLAGDVSSAGDVNGDGFDDIIVSEPHHYTADASSAGMSFVVFGKAKGFKATFDLATLDGSNGFRIDGALHYGYSGASVSSAGDVNGDGLDDLLLGAPGGANPEVFGAGTAYIVFGQAPTTAVHLEGTVASQSLVGGEQKDTLSGLGGDDALWGHGGKDKLAGSVGSDTLIGGGGKDVLTGGAGDDTFTFKDSADSTASASDTIRDLAAGDHLDLSAIDADTAAGGDQAFHIVSAFSHHAGELTVTYNAAKGVTLVQGDADGDGFADLAITVTGDHHDFTSFAL